MAELESKETELNRLKERYLLAVMSGDDLKAEELYAEEKRLEREILSLKENGDMKTQEVE